VSGFEGPIKIAFAVAVKRNTGSLKKPIRHELRTIVNHVPDGLRIVDTAASIEDVSREIGEVGLARVDNASLRPSTGAVFVALDQEHSATLFGRPEGSDASSETRSNNNKIPTTH
jgi:hypothetical protein